MLNNSDGYVENYVGGKSAEPKGLQNVLFGNILKMANHENGEEIFEWKG